MGGPASFFVRFAALPFWPRLWRESAELGAGSVVAPLALWVLIAAGFTAAHAATAVRRAVHEAASYYEANADPLLLEHGRFSLKGERILRYRDPSGSFTVLIDPEGTVPDSELGSDWVAVRADKVVSHQPNMTREYPVAEVARLFGDPVLFDAGWLRRAADGGIYNAVLVGVWLFATLAQLAVCALLGLAVGLLLLLLRGQWIGLGYAACAKVALATSAVLVAAEIALDVLGGEPPLRRAVLWPLVMTVLGFVALAWRGPHDEPDAAV